MAKKNRKPSKMEEMLERYGPAAFVTWFTIFFSTIGLFYALLSMGVDLDALVLGVVAWWGSDGSTWRELSQGADDHWLGFLGAKLVVAYLGAQIVKPVRIALFVALTPVVHRLWTRTSAPPPSGNSEASDDEASEPSAAAEASEPPAADEASEPSAAAEASEPPAADESASS